MTTIGALALAAADRHAGDALTRPGAPAVAYPQLGRAVREIAGDLTQDEGELTPTMKIKRPVVTARYAAALDALYVA